MSSRSLQLRPADRGRSVGNRRRVASKAWRRGAAAVEFALVAPLIFLFLFLGIEFGRVLMALHGLEAAARQGCRVAVSWDATEEEIESTVEARLASFGISDYDLTLDPNPPSRAEQWQPVTVRIEATYDSVSWLPVPRFLGGITLAGSSTLPQESGQGKS